ncbi:MAG: ArsC/Spx/MgsR family protein [Pseudomonadota bacterium]
MTLQIYGYPGCTTVKKSVRWAEENGLSADYTHFSKVGDLKSELTKWVEAAGIEQVFNQKAQTFKKLSEDEQTTITSDEASMIAAMATDPRFIKRPIGTDGKTVLTGFDVGQWENRFL